MIYACYSPWQRSFSYFSIQLPWHWTTLSTDSRFFGYHLKLKESKHIWRELELNPGHLAPLDNGTPGSLPPSYVSFCGEAWKGTACWKNNSILEILGSPPRPIFCQWKPVTNFLVKHSVGLQPLYVICLRAKTRRDSKSRPLHYDCKARALLLCYNRCPSPSKLTKV